MIFFRFSFRFFLFHSLSNTKKNWKWGIYKIPTICVMASRHGVWVFPSVWGCVCVNIRASDRVNEWVVATSVYKTNFPHIFRFSAVTMTLVVDWLSLLVFIRFYLPHALSFISITDGHRACPHSPLIVLDHVASWKTNHSMVWIFLFGGKQSENKRS